MSQWWKYTMSSPTALNVENRHGLTKYSTVEIQIIAVKYNTNNKMQLNKHTEEQTSFLLGFMRLLVCHEVHPSTIVV